MTAIATAPQEKSSRTLRARRDEAAALLRGGEVREALRVLRVLIRNAPWDLDARLLVADGLLLLGEPVAAIDVYRAIAVAAVQGGHGLRAAVAGKVAEALDPANAEIVHGIADIYSHDSSRISRVGVRLPVDDLDKTVPTVITRADDEVQAAAEQAASLQDLPLIAAPLMRAPLLSDLPEAGAREALEAARLVRAPAGEVLLAPGTWPAAIALVARGAVDFFEVAEDGEERVLGHSGEGALLGHEGFVDAVPLRYGVRARTDVDLLEIPSAVLARIAQSDPGAGVRLGRVLREQFLQTVVRTSPLFVALPTRERFELLRRMQPITIPAGATFDSRGATDAPLALIVSGSMLVYPPGALGDTPPVETLRAGDLVGVVAALGGPPSEATIVAVAETALLLLEGNQVRRLAAAFPGLGPRLGRDAEQRRSLLRAAPEPPQAA